MKVYNLNLSTGNYKRFPNLHINKFLSKSKDVEFIDTPCDDFYYIVAHITNWVWYKENPTYDQRLITDLQQNKAALIISCVWDSLGIIPTYGLQRSPNVLTLIKETARLFCIEPTKILYTDCNFVVEKVLANYNFKGIWANVWENNYNPIDIDSIISDIESKKLRDKKFLYFGGKPREHRLRFLNELLRIDDFEKNSYVSTAPGNFIETDTNIPKYMESKILDIDEVTNRDGMNDLDAEALNPYYHINSYINIIPNSYFYTNHTRLEINEKLFKPMLCLQPFILLGEPNTLSALQQLGYKTFSAWIDESYDTLLDDKKRMDKVIEQINKLNNMSYDQLSDMLYEMLPVLEHNYNLNLARYNSLEIYDNYVNKVKNYFNQLY